MALTGAQIERTCTLTQGPLLPLLPPKPISRSLPPLPARSPPPSLLPGWTCDTFTLPAAFPRSYKGSTKRPTAPRAPLPQPGPDGRVNSKEAFRVLVKAQVDGFRQEVSMEDRAELDGQEQLQVVVNRYRPKRKRSDEDGQQGLTLVFSHANGFYKEVWEPTLAALLAQLEADGTALPVDEVWAWDCVNQGDAAVLNQDVLGDVFNWADHGRDLLNLIISYIDSPSLSSPTPSSPLSPAATVPPSLLSLDTTPQSAGPTAATSRTYRSRLIVGIGHSLGGGATAYAASAVPSLFSSVVFVDPVLPQPDIDTRTMEALSTQALLRKEKWASREEALGGFAKKPFFQAWDRRVLEGYVEHGLKEVEGGVTLKCTARDEALTFCDPMAIAARRATTRLSSLPSALPVHFVFADHARSVLAEPQIDYLLTKAVPHATHSRVKGAGHLVVHEKPDETARLIAAFLRVTYPKKGEKERAKL